MSSEWPLWEVFIRGQHGLNHRHVGSLHAPDAEMAIRHARDVYTRRNEGVSIWVVKSVDIAASSPSEKGPLFEPSNTRSIATRPSSTSPTKWGTCDGRGRGQAGEQRQYGGRAVIHRQDAAGGGLARA